jgi:hypothetical protein
MEAHLGKVEEAKVTKHTPSSARMGWAFSPLAFNTWGALGPASSKVLRSMVNICTGDAGTQEAAVPAQIIWQSLSFVLIRGVASQLAAVTSITHPPYCQAPSESKGRRMELDPAGNEVWVWATGGDGGLVG